VPPYQADGVAVAAVNAIEDRRWIVMLMGYDDDKPGRTIDEFRAACLKLPLLFGEAAEGDALTEDILTYHQGDSRRRNFAGLENLPAGLVSVGDAVASFNPIYGQGMSSAALHAACLSQYLMSDPDHDRQADGFFALENVVVDAAWSLSAGSDLARLDALSGASVPEDIAGQRWALDQLLRAVLVDETVSAAVNDVAFMVAHPGTLADPVLLERAVTANQRAMAG
jgi:2-polyprenyl-6-methoxyphenol hydroxylase-like FAD-dependent oxidoreductase